MNGAIQPLAVLDDAAFAARRAAVRQSPRVMGVSHIEVVSVEDDVVELRVVFLTAVDGTLSATGRSILEAVTPANVSVSPTTEEEQPLRVVTVMPDDKAPHVLCLKVVGGAALPSSLVATYRVDVFGVEGIDPYFSTAEVVIDQPPSDLPASPSPQGDAAQPHVDGNIDYRAKDYESFRDTMLRSLSRVIPQWQERSPAAQSVALVEALAYLANDLSYFQDAVATEAFLGTARRRISATRHATLVDYRPSQGVNARMWARIVVEDGKHLELKAGTPLLTRIADLPVVLTQPEEVQAALQAGSVVFETMEAVRLDAAKNRLQFYAAGARKAKLPAGATRAWLRGRHPELVAGDVLALHRADSDVAEVVGGHGGHVIRLSRVGAAKKDGPYDVWITEIEWFEGDALPRAIEVVAPDPDGTVRGGVVAHGNVVLADHGRTVPGRAAPDIHPSQLELPAVPEGGHYEPALPLLDPTFRVDFRPRTARQESAKRALQQDPRAATPAVSIQQDELDLGTRPWNLRPDLFESGPFAPDFVVEMAEDTLAQLRFGDGINGLRPAPGARFAVSMRVGNGVRGNVGFGALGHVVLERDPGTIVAVTNPTGGRGGENAESLSRIKTDAPTSYFSQQRAVTADDIARLARRVDGVTTSAAHFSTTGSYSVAMLYVRQGRRWTLAPSFVERVRDHVAPRLVMGSDLEVCPPVPLPLDIVIAVRLRRHTLRVSVVSALESEFSPSAMFGPDAYGFGQPLYLSTIISAASKVEGVFEVEATRFQRWGHAAAGELAAGVVRPGPNQIIRVDNNPRMPSHGTIRFEIAGGR